MTLTNFFQTKGPIHQVYHLAKQVLIIDTSPTCVKRLADEIIDLNKLNCRVITEAKIRQHEPSGTSIVGY